MAERPPISGGQDIEDARGPGGLLYSYAADTASGPEVAQRGPRQFADTALSHCAWGSPCTVREFMGGDAT